MSRFFQVNLRTLDVEAARAFYACILGGTPRIFRLHEQALARGARPHWLGMIDVDDVDRAVDAFVARGGAPLGPKWSDETGLEAANVRDPGGAVVGLAKPAASARGEQLPHPEPEIAWYLLHAANLSAVQEAYALVAGWQNQTAVAVAEHGTFHPFAWRAGGPAIGSMIDVASHATAHPHWLFLFRVDALDAAIAKVDAAGGKVIGPFVVPGGDRIAVCDDPEGAAFGLYERSGGPSG